MHSDPIADMLTRIRNAARAGHSTLCLPHSKMKLTVAQILATFGFVQKVRTVKHGKFEEIEISLDSEKKDIVLTRKSTPGRRYYVSAEDIRPVRNGYGIGIISTSQGIMTTKSAKEKGVGGEILCEVY